MGHNNGLIYAPINIEQDIAATLCLTTGGVGFLCGDVDGNGNRLDAVNPFSLIKPVRYSHFEHSAGWNASDNDNYGIAPKITSTGTSAQGLAALLTQTYDGKMNGWEYEAPRGTANNRKEYFRPDDYHGYKHDSPRLWNGMAYINRVVYGGQFACGLNDVVSDYNYDQQEAVSPDSIYYAHILLSVSDTQKRLSACYFGVAVFDSNNNCVHVSTCDKAMGAEATAGSRPDEKWSVELDNVSWSIGTYTAYPFFWISDTSGPMPSNWQSDPYGAFYTVPYTMPFTIDVVGSANSSISGTCGIDPAEPGDLPSQIRIGYDIKITVSYATLELRRFRLWLDDGTLIYDSANDSQYSVPTMDSASGVTDFNLITSLDGTEIGIVPNCPVQKVVPSGNYKLNAKAWLSNAQGTQTTELEWFDNEIS